MSGKQSDFDILIEHGIDIRGRTIYLTGEINEERADKFIKLIKYLDKTAGDITVILNSEGGCVTSGFAIYDTIKACRNEVTIKVYGCAMSMGSIILQAGDRRIIGVNGRVMIHKGAITLDDHVTNVEKAVKESKDLEVIMTDIYLEKIKEVKHSFRRSQIEKMMEFDSYLSSAKALELGLVDEIEGEDLDQ